METIVVFFSQIKRRKNEGNGSHICCYFLFLKQRKKTKKSMIAMAIVDALADSWMDSTTSPNVKTMKVCSLLCSTLGVEGRARAPG